MNFIKRLEPIHGDPLGRYKAIDFDFIETKLHIQCGEFFQSHPTFVSHNSKIKNPNAYTHFELYLVGHSFDELIPYESEPGSDVYLLVPKDIVETVFEKLTTLDNNSRNLFSIYEDYYEDECYFDDFANIFDDEPKKESKNVPNNFTLVMNSAKKSIKLKVLIALMNFTMNENLYAVLTDEFQKTLELNDENNHLLNEVA